MRRRVKDKQNDRDFLPLNVWNIRIINLLNPGALGVPPVHFWIHPLFFLSASIRFSPQLSLTSRSHKGLFNHDFMCWSLYCQFTFCASSIITGSAAGIKWSQQNSRAPRAWAAASMAPLIAVPFDILTQYGMYHIPWNIQILWQTAIITPWLD